MATTLIKYALRRKSDGFYMPRAEGRNGRGGSYMEPANPASKANEVRLFDSSKAATIALKAWCKGKWVASRGQSSSGPDFESEYYEDLEIVPQPGRSFEDFSVVAVEVRLP